MKALHSLLALAAFASPAFAQDLPIPAVPTVYVAPVGPYTWSGCYAGGFGAADIAHIDTSLSDTRANRFATGTPSRAILGQTTASTPNSTFGPLTPFFRTLPDGSIQTGNPAITPGTGKRTRTTTTTTVTTTTVRNGGTVAVVNAVARNRAAYGATLVGGDGGGRVGCNYQTGRLVLGAQLEGGYLGIDGTTYDPARRSTASAIGGGVYGALTGRVGYAIFERTLVYVRGGVGYADLSVSTFDPRLGFNNSTRGSGAMPLVGAGIEYRLTPQISLTGEYTYMRPECRTVGYAFAITAGGGGTSTTCIDKHMIAFGLNYYFTSQPAPVGVR